MFASGVHSTSAAWPMEARARAAKAAARKARNDFIRPFCEPVGLKDKHYLTIALLRGGRKDLSFTGPLGHTVSSERLPGFHLSSHGLLFLPRSEGRTLRQTILPSTFSCNRPRHQSAAFSTSSGSGSRIEKRRPSPR